MIGAVDLHAHLLPRAWLEEVARNPKTYGMIVAERKGIYELARLNGAHPFQVFRALREEAEERLSLMNKMGLETQVLAPPTMVLGYDLPELQAVAVARLFNETIDDVARASDGRLIPAATVPMAWPSRAVTELEYAVEGLGHRLAFIATDVVGRSLEHDDFMPFFRRASELNVPVQIHPPQYSIQERLRPHFLSNMLGNPIETTIAAASLIYGGVLDTLPELRVILVHGGGALPYLFGRMRHGYNNVIEAHVSRNSPEKYANLYFDTIVHDSNALRYLVETVGRGRLVIGTDSPWPMGDYDPAKSLEAVGLRNDHRVLRGNAEVLLGK